MYLTQTELGEVFGVTSHQIGRWLIEIGLRTPDKQPSRKAFAEGFVAQSPLDTGGCFYKWDQDKTVKALENAGHRRKTPESTNRIVGPFTAQESGTNGYEIVSGNGTVSVWVVGHWNAETVTALLNLAYRHGKLGGDSLAM
jgi:hypothetical protein